MSNGMGATAWTYAKAFGASVVSFWFVITFIIGLVLLIVSHLFDPQTTWSVIMADLGKLILLSGFFASFVKWMTVSGVIKQEMHNVLYGKDFLSTPPGFDLALGNLVTVSVETYLPALSQHLNGALIRAYLPDAKAMYYTDYHQGFDVYWHDKAKGVLRVIESCELTVVCSDDTPHVLPFRFVADAPTGMGVDYEFLDLKINGADRLSEVRKVVKTENGYDNFDIQYDLKLEGSKEYKYLRRMQRYILLGHEPFMAVSLGKHTYCPDVTIKCHEPGLRVYFTETGTLKEFETVAGNNRSDYMKHRYPELLLRSQGFVIYFAAS